jgi:hypothetical protein
MGCEEVRLLLEERVSACRGEVEWLRGELARVAELVGDRESELARLSTALQVVAALPVIHTATVASSVAAAVLPAARSGEALEGEAFNTGVLAALRSGPVGGMRCRELVVAMGLEPVPRLVERVRHRGKRLVEQGIAVEARSGLFTLAAP